jgi:tetratricopeptide (TPR) repeat protein
MGVMVGQAARWMVSVVGALAAFAGCWWGLQAAAGWHLGDALALAAVPFGVVFGVSSWWAGRDRSSAKPSAGSENGANVAESSPGALAVGRAEGPVFGPGGDYRGAHFIFHPGEGAAPRSSSNAELALPQVVVGDIPREPPAMQPRTDLVGALAESAGSGIAVVCAVTGARGVGKTQIAAAYARSRVAAGWPLVAWIDADGPGALLDDLEQVAERLGLRHEDDHAVTAARRLRSWLEGRSQPGLLVFDNATSADVLMPWIPATGRTQVVITGNHQALGRLGHLVQVDVYTPAEAVAYLNRACGRVDVAGAAAVADELGCLPLAVAQAAAVIAAQRLDYATYLERLRSLPVVTYLARSEGDPYPRGTAEAILLSLAEVEDRDPAGLCRPVIELLAILSPAGVPRRLLHQAGQARFLPRSGRRRQPTKPIAAVEVDAAVQRLDEASLLSLSVDGLTTTVHRLVMRVVRERAEDKGSLTALAAAAADLLRRQLAVPREQTWAQHAATGEIITQTTALWENTSSCLTAIESVHDDSSTIRKVLSLRLKAVWYLNEISDPTRATLLGEDLVADCRRLLGDDHPFTVGTRSNLARAYELAGRLDEAIALHERVLADCQRLLGDDHPDTVGTRSNLARAYQSAGRLDEAIALHERVLADCQRLLGEDDPRTETAHRNLDAADACCCPPAHDVDLVEYKFWACVRLAQPSWRFYWPGARIVIVYRVGPTPARAARH